jgi:hypothetical protein
LFAVWAIPGKPPKFELNEDKEPADWFVSVRTALRMRIAVEAQALGRPAAAGAP